MVKKKLSLVEPTLRTDEGFEYEEGEGLDDDEVAANTAKLLVMLDKQSGQRLSQRKSPMPSALLCKQHASCVKAVL